MKRALKATFNGQTIVPDEPVDWVPGQAVEVRPARADDEPVPGSAAAARRLIEELRATPKLDAEAMRQFRQALAEGTQPRADISPFFEIEEQMRREAEGFPEDAAHP